MSKSRIKCTILGTHWRVTLLCTENACGNHKTREYITIENSAIHSSRGLRCIAS